MKQMTGTLILLMAAFIWGTAFVAQSSASGSVSSFTFNAARSFVACAFLFIFTGIRSLVHKQSKVGIKKILTGGICCGIPLFVASNLQQFGLAVYPDGVAASGRAGFLTATYVVMVALCAGFLRKKRPHPLLWIAVAGCLTGMYFLCLSGGFSGFYLGDALELGCALFFTVQILMVDRFSKIDSVKMCCAQFFVCGILSGLGMIFFETPSLSSLSGAWVEILYVGLMSSGIAYTLQMAGQKRTEPAVASIVMSLESVFAALAGWLILNEKLQPIELLGCGLVFASVILAQVPGFIKASMRSVTGRNTPS